jgi:hypothetical protein
MSLLEDALGAAGGLDRWRELETFTAFLSLRGRWACGDGKSPLRDEVVAQGSTRAQSLRLTCSKNRCMVYQPDQVSIENFDGTPSLRRIYPTETFAHPASKGSWDDLDLAHFLGFSLWNCMTAPFHIALPGVMSEEIKTCRKRGQTWRCLKVIFPPSILTYSPVQTFYFDERSHIVRNDYHAVDAQTVPIADYVSAYQNFSGISIATLHRSLETRSDGSILDKAPLVDIEIFDAAFE